MNSLTPSARRPESYSLLNATRSNQHYGSTDSTTTRGASLLPIQEENSNSFTSIGDFLGRAIQQVAGSLISKNIRYNILSTIPRGERGRSFPSSFNIEETTPFNVKDINNYASLTPSSVNQSGDFSRPVAWDRTSVEEALQFYQTQSSNIALPAQTKDRYDQLALLLIRMLQVKDDYNIANGERNDEADALLNAHTCLKNTVDLLLRGDTTKAHFLDQITDKYVTAALLLKKVDSLKEPHLLTGPLTVTIHKNSITEIHNLSEFSFKESGSMREYYKIITDPNIVRGSNMKTLQEQKNAIEEAKKNLEEIEKSLLPRLTGLEVFKNR